MALKLLVVDDSGFFQRRIIELLKSEPQIQVVGTADNGAEAIEKVKKLSPDVITMDYEMPVMDGITALREIMKIKPTPVLMFSSLTFEGARVTLDALEAGAVDFLLKNFDDISRGTPAMRKMLVEKILTAGKSQTSNLAPAAPEPARKPIERTPAPSRPVADSKPRETRETRETKAPVRPTVAPKSPPVGKSAPLGKIKLVCIGTSTGGPMALQEVLTHLPASFPAPILLIQHMPASFTPAFAERLNRLCKIGVKEAENGDRIKPGVAYLAPGGMQMMVDRAGTLKVMEGDERVTYKPSVDITFGSAAQHFGSNTLAVVLTGMGADGRDGARLLKEHGANVWAQDEASCVIYGMPAAVINSNLADQILPLKDFAGRLTKEVK